MLELFFSPQRSLALMIVALTGTAVFWVHRHYRVLQGGATALQAIRGFLRTPTDSATDGWLHQRDRLEQAAEKQPQSTLIASRVADLKALGGMFDHVSAIMDRLSRYSYITLVGLV